MASSCSHLSKGRSDPVAITPRNLVSSETMICGARELTFQAGLTQELVLPWKDETKYNTGNYTEQDLLWGKLRADSGVIALTKSYAAEHGLREGSPFPWDSEKDIYLINGFHSIHCVVSSRARLTRRSLIITTESAIPQPEGAPRGPTSESLFRSLRAQSRLAPGEHYVPGRRHTAVYHQFEQSGQRVWTAAEVPRLEQAAGLGGRAYGVLS
jgi:hypothetical protein